MKPCSVTLEVTKRCNLNCKMCFADAECSSHAPEIQFDVLKKCVEDLMDIGVKSFLVSGGEPTLYTVFKDLIPLICNKGIVPGIATNGTLLDVDLCRFLKNNGIHHNIYVSIDSVNADLHNQIRGADCFELTCRNLENLRKENISFAISSVIMNNNSDSIAEMYLFAQKHGASFLNLIRFNLEGRGIINQKELSLNEQLTFAKVVEPYIKRYKGIMCFGGENCILPIRINVSPKMFPDDTDLSKYLIIRANGDVQIGRASSNVIVGNLYNNSIRSIIDVL